MIIKRKITYHKESKDVLTVEIDGIYIGFIARRIKIFGSNGIHDHLYCIKNATEDWQGVYVGKKQAVMALRKLNRKTS